MLRLSLLLISFSSAAAAGEGEFNFDFVVSPEVASAVHPATPADTALFSDGATLVLKPRLGLGARYGLSSSFYVGLAAEIAPSTAITTKGATIENTSGDILTASYIELQAPVLLGYRFDSGTFLSGALELELAPLAVYWGTVDFVDPTDLDEEGRPAPFKTLDDTWVVGGVGRLSLLFTTRLFDFVCVDIGPTVAVAWAGAPSVHFGLLMRPSLLWGGPL
jgi:hypothetical protein